MNLSLDFSGKEVMMRLFDILDIIWNPLKVVYVIQFIIRDTLKKNTTCLML